MPTIGKRLATVAKIRAAKDSRAAEAGGAWDLEAWRAEAEAHQGETPAQWLARMTTPAHLAHWPAEKRERMAEQYAATAATLAWMNSEGML